MSVNNTHTKHDVFRWHDSPENYLAHISQPGVKEGHGLGATPDRYGEDWAGVFWEKALIKLEKGDAIRTAMASKLYDDIVIDMSPTTGRNIIAPSMVGFVPNIPAVLAGHPMTMLSRQISDDTSCYAPIRIFVETTVSSTLSATELINRGVAMLAFTMVMNSIRPIELYLISSGATDDYGYAGTAGNVVRIDTRPLDISRAAWMITDPAYARRIAFPALRHLVWDKLTSTKKPYYEDRVPLAWGAGFGPQYVTNMRLALEMEPQDILISGGYGGDKLMLTNPKTWVNKMVGQHMEKEAN